MRRQAIIAVNAGSLLIVIKGTNLSEFLIKIQLFSDKTINLKMSSARRWLFCLCLQVLIYTHWQNTEDLRLHFCFISIESLEDGNLKDFFKCLSFYVFMPIISFPCMWQCILAFILFLCTVMLWGYIDLTVCNDFIPLYTSVYSLLFIWMSVLISNDEIKIFNQWYVITHPCLTSTAV